MSDLVVEVCSVDGVEKHPNADRLDLVYVRGWSCVCRRGIFHEGDMVVYIPIDSVLPPELERTLFPPDSKISLKQSRVRTIRIRGIYSQGMLVSLEEVGLSPRLSVGEDVRETLGITKYEPPEPPTNMRTGNQKPKRQLHPEFFKYTNIQNLKNHPLMFDGEDVVVTEKIHGTNFRCGYVPFVAYNWKRKLKRFFGFAPKWEFVYGSHNVELQDAPTGKMPRGHFFKKNVYSEAVDAYNLRNLLGYGEVLYGEIYGSGIQKGYQYGCADGEQRLVVFDIMLGGVYFDFHSMKRICDSRGLPIVPVLYEGPFRGEVRGDNNTASEYVSGASVLEPLQKLREGIVIRTRQEQVKWGMRCVMKFINPAYLMKDQTEFH